MSTSIRFLPTADAELRRHDAAHFCPPCGAWAAMEIGQSVTWVPFGTHPNPGLPSQGGREFIDS